MGQKKGFKHTEESKKKISDANKGRKRTEETKRKISESHKGHQAWSKGYKHTEETRKKMSDKWSYEKIITPERNKKISNKLKELYAKGVTIGFKKGNKHSQWKGGIIKVRGYYYIYNPELGINFNRKYVKRCNLIWYKHTGELIKNPYLLHHINGIKDDDRIGNLQKVNQSEHMKLEQAKRKMAIDKI